MCYWFKGPLNPDHRQCGYSELAVVLHIMIQELHCIKMFMSDTILQVSSLLLFVLHIDMVLKSISFRDRKCKPTNDHIWDNKIH